jgi:GWxTD domain-containing protein
MLVVRWAALLGLAVLAQAEQRPAPPDSPLILRAVRSYRAEQHRTEVTAFLQVPYMILEPTSDSGGGLSYGVTVKVTDSTGLALLQQSWQNHAPEAMRQPQVFGVETVRFSLAPGRYRLDVGVKDSVSGRTVDQALDIQGFDSTPPASDLLLSPSIRPATADDTVPRPAELRWGKMLVTAAARLQLTPLRSMVYYLIEAYSGPEATGTLALKVVDSAGKTLTTTPATKIEVPPGGGVLKGQLDLTGLPAGRYTMKAEVALGGHTVERSADFAMAGLEQTLRTDVARREAARVTDAGYFDEMMGPELDAAKEPLQLIAKSGELSPWKKDLSLRGKRRFLADFWSRRDPTPGTQVNEARQRFYDAIAFANKNYGEHGRAATPGWKTDRGRVFVRNGKPDDVLTRPAAGRAPPYEVWHFTTGKNRYYIFLDRAEGLGNYQLIATNDIQEQSLPNWQELLHKEDAVIDISRFLGIELETGAGERINQ